MKCTNATALIFCMGKAQNIAVVTQLFDKLLFPGKKVPLPSLCANFLKYLKLHGLFRVTKPPATTLMNCRHSTGKRGATKRDMIILSRR